MIEKLYTVFNTINLQTVIICVYNLMLCLLFFILHMKKSKTSCIFQSMFYIAVLLISYCSVIYLQNQIWISFFMSTLLFLLTEQNQGFMRKSYEQLAAEDQNKLIGQHIDEVQSIYLTMRGWRHDYHNHMQTLKAHMAMKQYDLASKYLNELEKDLDDIDTLIKSGNVNLDAILNSKLSLAKSREIDVNCRANLPEKLTVSDIDLCVLIGNLVDNALEACDNMPKGEEKFLRIYIGIFKQQLYISVTNSTKEVVRKFDYEYITNKRGNHGHGLKRIDNTANKYQGYINRKNEPGVFVAEIMLPL
jgi:two-component system, LytTR family, sensor histidine kinase AgrC